MEQTETGFLGQTGIRAEIAAKGRVGDPSCSQFVDHDIRQIALARCDCLMDRYLKWKGDNHRKSDIAQRAALIFTAITPVLLLLPWGYVNILGAATSALAAIATGFLSISGWRDQYVRYGYVWHALQTEKFLYLTAAAKEYQGCDPDEAARRFASRIEQLVQDEVSQWRTLMQRVDEAPVPTGESETVDRALGRAVPAR